ncbi:MAG: hypothetical protein LBC02_10725 [Planctomycetaceae bacterium]|jgi:hypothetical protein|nr:hypothetical protein [Planctomycetaceae bacterium]
MKKKNKENEVLRELRRIRQKHYEETKNMTFEEQGAYYHRGAEDFDRKYSKTRKVINAGTKDVAQK